MTQRTTNNKRPRDNSEVDSPPRKIRGRGHMAQPPPVSSRPRSLTPPPLDPRRPTYFIPDDSSIKLNHSSPATQRENALSAAVANSSLYKNALKKYADEYEKVVSLEDKNNGLEKEKKNLEEQVENLKAQLKARDSPLARSLSFAPAVVLSPTPAPVLTARSEDVERAARQSTELEELKQLVKKKDNEMREVGGRIVDLSSENEKLKNQLLFAQSQSSNHERTLALISNLFGIRHLLSTSGDLLVNRIESIHHQFKRDETARIDSNCAAKHQELWNNEVQSLRQLFVVECEKYRVAVVEEAKMWLEKGGVVVESQATIPTMAPPPVVPVVVVSAPTITAPEPLPAPYFPAQFPTQVRPENTLSPVVESPITTPTLSLPIEDQIFQNLAVEMDTETPDVPNTAMDITAQETVTSTELVIQSPITTPAPEPEPEPEPEPKPEPEPAAIRSIQTPEGARPRPAGQVEGPALFATPTGPSVATMLAEAKAASKGEKYTTVVEDESKILGPATISTPDQIAQRKVRAPKGRLQIQYQPIVQPQPQAPTQSRIESVPAAPVVAPIDGLALEKMGQDTELEQDMWKQFGQMDQEQERVALVNQEKMLKEKEECDGIAESKSESYPREKEEKAQAPANGLANMRLLQGKAQEPSQDQAMEQSEGLSQSQSQSQPKEQSQIKDSNPDHDTSLTSRLDALMMSPIPSVSGSSSSRVTVEPQPQRRSERIATRQAVWERNKK